MQQSSPTAAFAVNRQRSLMRTTAKRRMMQLIPVLVVFYSIFLLPPEVEFSVFGVNLPAYRVALLVVSVPALWSSMQSRTAGLQFMDAAVAIIGFWTILSFTMIYGFGVGMVRGTGVIIDTLLPYFVVRTSIKSLDDLRYFLILVLPAMGFAGLTLLAESVSGRPLLSPAFASIFGNKEVYSGGENIGGLAFQSEMRMGLLRAFGPFPHPILAGIMMIGFLPLYYFSGLRSWPFIGGIFIALTGVFGLSSAAFLALIVAVAGIVIYHVKAYIPKISWWTISSLLILLVGTLHMASKNGIIYVIARLTLTPHTAEHRIRIWHWGSISVRENPWFGIGYKDWQREAWMGESVDAHFLLMAMRHGLVVPIMMLAAIFYGMIRLGIIIPHLSPKDRAFAIGINMCMIIYVIVGQTVNYFGSSNIFYMSVIALVGSAVSWGSVQMQIGWRQRLPLHAQALRQNLA